MKRRKYPPWRIVRPMLAVLAILASASPLAAAATAGAVSRAPVADVAGRVLDLDTGQPLGGVLVRLVERGRSTLTDVDGYFAFIDLPAGRVTITASRLGYAPETTAAVIGEAGVERIEIRLTPSALELPGIVAAGAVRDRAATETFQATAVVEGAELRRRLTASLASTLAGEPGLAERYNGPVASQPVIRGLGGDRVLILEDGARTGDISSTGGDHAVTIDPLTAERVEVLRGPSGLLYGSNAIGGVINVVRDDVPRSVPERIEGTVHLQAESVNQGVVGGGAVRGGAGRLAMRAEVTGRAAGETRTPLGELPATDLRGYNGGVGASLSGRSGYLGAAVRDYGIRYGVPGNFDGQTVPGAHEEGVEIDLRRTSARVDGEWYTESSLFHALDFSGSYTRFEQDELELEEEGAVVGTRFGQLMATGRLVAHHHHDGERARLEGAVGLSGRWKDFAAAGSNTGSRPAEELTFAAFGYEEFAIGRTRLQAGARFDWYEIAPEDTASTLLLRNVRQRDLGAVSGSLAILREIADGVSVGGSVARSFRAPAVEELYSGGPHLASYSFEIGNPDLGAEFGLGTELFLRIGRPRFTGEAAVFRNALTDFIYYAPTGRLDPRFNRYPVYRAAQSDATLIGAEGQLEWEVIRGLALGTQASYVRGSRRPDDEPLPAIPPLTGEVSARYEQAVWFTSLGVRWAGEQSRTGEFEDPTDGFALVNVAAGLRRSSASRLQTITLVVDNVTNAVWRDHLSRIRAVAPQPGRNVRLLFRFEI